MKSINKWRAGLITIGVLASTHAVSQQQMENSMSQYFQHRMIWNAGFTGADGNRIYVLQNRSWAGFDGAPVMTGISGELLFGANAAAGLQVLMDITGVLRRTFVIGNYAYRVKLNHAEQLRIGVSLAFASDRLNNDYIDQGGAPDPTLASSIDPKIQFDGNIGLVYTKDKLTIGISSYRLRENFTAKEGGRANLAFLQIGGSYDIGINEQLQVKPLLMMRLYRATNMLADIGARLEYRKLLDAMIVYQTSGNIRAGAGIRPNDWLTANFFYNTNVRVATAASQQYELGIGFYLRGKKQD